MIKKQENTMEDIKINIFKIQEIIESHDNFFFYFSPDPDAVGVSIAFALYLRHMHKESAIYLPEGFDPNLDFLFDIASYNKIKIIKEFDKVLKHLKEYKPLFVTCDTATHFLLPHFNEINQIREKLCPKISVELDHHFGGDSEIIFENSITLFSKSNSSCEILAEFIETVGKNKFEHIDKMFPRNIVLSLLIGICFDTQFGKFVVDQNNYDKWFAFLSERLKEITYSNPKYLNSGTKVFEAINKMNETKLQILEDLVKKTRVLKNIGLLIIPPIGIYDSLAPSGDSTCILSKIVSDLSNLIPEFSGKIGILAYFDDVSRIYFLKIRRSYAYKDFDLREFESILTEIFGKEYMGGGGHAGATSFRLNYMERSEFIDKIEEFHIKVSKII
ncbi:MAG TPA: hypothetical protein PK771_01360 [Spirochaetota bacterium]|nr:hypothetical protein [Spirochaetota bacterium]